MSKRALITGITGQDGSYLAELLLEKGYEVYGMVREKKPFNTKKIEHIIKKYVKEKKLFFVKGDLTDEKSISEIIKKVKPDEIYNLAAQSNVGISFKVPEYTSDVIAMGTLRILEAIKNFCPAAKFFQASSSQIYGNNVSTQEGTIPFSPQSPYAIAKAFAHEITENYRKSQGVFACNGILYNHESPRRGKEFITKKIVQEITKIKYDLQNYFEVGNLNSKRDWGFAGDYVEAMWLMLQQEKPDNYVIGTGETHSVREFIEEAFRVVGMEIIWEGQGLDEVGKVNGKVVVKVNPKFYRPAEVDILLSNPEKAKRELGWEPRTKFRELVRMMVESDLEELSHGLRAEDKSGLDINGNSFH